MMLPTPFQNDCVHHSGMILPGGPRVPVLADSGPCSLQLQRSGANTGGENEHAPSARSPSIEVGRRRGYSGDCASHWCDAVDGSQHPQALLASGLGWPLPVADDR
jgi:hypothetical protein